MFANHNCAGVTKTAAGEVHVTRWLSENGALSSTVVLWTARSAADPDLFIVARWEAHAPTRIDFDHGLVMFDQDKVTRSERNQHYRLELRANATPPWEGYGVIEGRTQLQHGVRLSADWADVVALTKGADHLFLVLKDRHGKLLSSQPLDRTMFDGIVPAAQKLLVETDAMVRDFRTRCSSDEGNDIVV